MTYYTLKFHLIILRSLEHMKTIIMPSLRKVISSFTSSQDQNYRYPSVNQMARLKLLL